MVMKTQIKMKACRTSIAVGQATWDFGYANSALMTGGTEGQQLGDHRWTATDWHQGFPGDKHRKPESVPGTC